VPTPWQKSPESSGGSAYDFGVPAARVNEAVQACVPEPVLCWCLGQSLESRYSSSTGTVGGAAAGKLIGGGVLHHNLGKERLGDAFRMPRFPVVAVSAERIYLFEWPIPATGAFATMRRDEVQVIYGGNAMWKRLDLITSDGDASRSYTMMASTLFGAGRRLKHVVDVLGSGGRT
jgi:hypothetical protein